MKSLTTYKTSKIGEIKIDAKIEYAAGGNPRTNITISAKGITHKYPYASIIRKDTLYLTEAYYNKTSIRGLQDLPSDLLKWWEEATLFIRGFKEEIKSKELEESKKEDTVTFTLNTNSGFYSSNTYAKELLTKVPRKTRNLITDNAKLLDTDMGDYAIDYKYSINLRELERLTKKAIIVHEDAKKERLRKIAREELEKAQSGKNIGYKNLRAVDGDLITGMYHYAVNQKFSMEDWTKVKHLFNFIDTTVASDEFDSMLGSCFKGYATTNPAEVCNILYPNWEKKLKEKRIEELEYTIKTGEVFYEK